MQTRKIWAVAFDCYLLILALTIKMLRNVKKVAVVTGANKGVGFEIVRGLGEKFPGIVYLTARNETKGKDTVQELEKLGFHLLFHQLDITDQSSVDKFKQHIETIHGGLDVLVNNASIMFARNATDPPLAEQAEKTMEVNYFGIIRVCNALFPLLRDNAEVVNVSSSAGHLYKIPSATVRAKFEDPDLTIEELTKLMETFVKDAKENKTDQVWSNLYCCHILSEVGISYIVSKMGVSTLTFLQNKLFDEVSSRNISVKAVCPGMVKTDINASGILTHEEAARYVLLCLYNNLYEI